MKYWWAKIYYKHNDKTLAYKRALDRFKNKLIPWIIQEFMAVYLCPVCEVWNDAQANETQDYRNNPIMPTRDRKKGYYIGTQSHLSHGKVKFQRYLKERRMVWLLLHSYGIWDRRYRIIWDHLNSICSFPYLTAFLCIRKQNIRNRSICVAYMLRIMLILTYLHQLIFYANYSHVKFKAIFNPSICIPL